MAEATQPSAKRSVTIGIPVEYFLIGDVGAKHDLQVAKKEVWAATAQRIKSEDSLLEFIARLKELSPVFVTGSSGFLGAALVETLRLHDIRTFGIDLVEAPTTDFIGCVSDVEILRKATNQSCCESVIHTAALHAPNLDYYPESEFERINVQGMHNVLMIAEEFNMKAIVFSSTTSLMITNDVKLREEKHERVVLKQSVDYGTPRNIYGVTKKAAERICLDNDKLNIGILRCSRFFVEDVFDTSANPSERSIKNPNGNVKANEMLCGLRASLEDTVMAHLVTLVRI